MTPTTPPLRLFGAHTREGTAFGKLCAGVGPEAVHDQQAGIEANGGIEVQRDRAAFAISRAPGQAPILACRGDSRCTAGRP